MELITYSPGFVTFGKKMDWVALILLKNREI